MKKINEKKIGNLSVYEVVNTANNKTYSKRTINYKIGKHNCKYVLYDQKMNIIPEVYKYLNEVKCYRSQNTMKYAAYALKHIYSFCDIFGYDLFDLDFAGLNKLNSFLAGYSQDGDFEIKFVSKRSKKTIRSIFGYYKEFCEWTAHTVQENRIKTFCKTAFPDSGSLFLQKNKTTTSVSVPKFIKPSELTKIIQYIRKSNEPEEIKTRNELMVKIGFQSGRLGEILGATLEDFDYRDRYDSNGELKRDYFIITRNRMTDELWQSSKSNMKVRDVSDYGKPEYFTYMHGYSKLYITEDIYKMFEKYVDTAHVYHAKHHKERYRNAKADAVDKYKKMHYDNYYVFLNKYGSKLTASSFNKELRQIFKAVGLEIDEGTRQENLFHRFRHGFAMHYIFAKNGKEQFAADQHGGFTELDRGYLTKLMRHKNSSSLDYYFNPTEEQIVDYKEEMEKDLYVGEIINIEEV